MGDEDKKAHYPYICPIDESNPECVKKEKRKKSKSRKKDNLIKKISKSLDHTLYKRWSPAVR